MGIGDSDHLDSDDLDVVLDMSRMEYEQQIVAGPSNFDRSKGQPAYLKKQAIKEQIAQIDAEIAAYEKEKQSIQALINLRKDDKTGLLRELESLHTSMLGKGKGKAQQGLNYEMESFEWSEGLKGKMKEIFGINSFRLCQEGVCNANMDGRDIVCIMPTGGGKSLTYQLPALLQRGCTLVISPLISLITDQVLHLQEKGIQAVKITGGTSKEEARDTNQRLQMLSDGKGRSTALPPIKLCYVTPEKIAKSKSFVSLLQKLVNAGQLARIVIDEAHCVSQLGHDFRPDYQKLHVLRQLFPNVPIMALSATCPPKVLDDLVKTLRLKPVVSGNGADAHGTVYFSSPLYRKNLHYKVLPKPAKGSDVMQVMTDWILQHHPQDTGIIYCLTKKDAENVAEDITRLSNGKIKTGVYHADRHDRDKEALHIAWRRGNIKVVCATIAFGLGIDKGDVRFVLHHSLSKSLEGFYQESGRAGRDGKDSDCVLYYRPQDGTTLSAMVASEKEGQIKLLSMLSFAQNLAECRKTQFAKYFSYSSQLAMSSWTTGDSDALTPCGHCDNCVRPPEETVLKNVTLEAWQLLKIAAAVEQNGGNLTLNMLAALARGAGGGTYDVTQGGGKRGRGKTREKMELDLDEVAGGAVALTKDEIEHLLVELLIQRYLQERYHQTAYATCVYLTPGPLAPRLMRRNRGDIETAPGLKVECVFRSSLRKSKSSSRTKSSAATTQNRMRGPKEGNTLDDELPVTNRNEKRKRGRMNKQSDEDGSRDEEVEIVSSGREDRSPRLIRPRIRQVLDSDVSEDEDDVIDYDWSHTMRDSPRPVKKQKNTQSTYSAPSSSRNTDTSSNVRKRHVQENSIEVFILSD